MAKKSGSAPRRFSKGNLVAVAVIAVAALAGFLWPGGRETATDLTMEPFREAGSPAAPSSPGGFLAGPEDVRDHLLKAHEELAAAKDAESARELFEKMRRVLAAAPTNMASAGIISVLDSGIESTSGLPFLIAPNGFLEGAPSLRVFLLDQLGRVDPKAAARYAEALLETSDSADEWAICLRNYALGARAPDASRFLQRKFREMLARHAWRSNPSTGFLEAFDIPVHVGGTELVPDLAELVRQKENQALAHAAYLALDRLTIQDPAGMLARLGSDPALLEGREATRANLFARANVEDERQREILGRYLLGGNCSEAELQVFAGLFPNGNFMVSRNLLSAVRTPTRADLARQDQAALRVVNEWLTNPQFDRIRPALLEIKRRLETFVAEPGAGQ